MKAAPFEYVRPGTVAEASAALGRSNAATAAIAGGQSLVPMLNLRVSLIDVLVDLSRLAELKEVTETRTGIRIGALTTHAAIEDGKVPDLFGGLMRRVASTISYRAIRNHGTIGGSLALADPAADWPACLIALGASLRLSGPNGVRSQLVADFVQGTYSTSLASGEIILGVDIPRPDAALHWGFAKVVRKSGAFASSIAVVTARGRGGPVAAVLGAASPRPRSLSTLAMQLQRGTASEESLRTAIAADIEAHAPDADAYQKRLHTATVLRAIREMRIQ
jgi:carbon-monoxide dehydrogenase medium subunit